MGPLFTSAAAICEPPILSPTIFFELVPGSPGSAVRGRDGRASFGSENLGAAIAFDFGFGSEAGSAASHSFGPRLSEKSRL